MPRPRAVFRPKSARATRGARLDGLLPRRRFDATSRIIIEPFPRPPVSRTTPLTPAPPRKRRCIVPARSDCPRWHPPPGPDPPSVENSAPPRAPASPGDRTVSAPSFSVFPHARRFDLLPRLNLDLRGRAGSGDPSLASSRKPALTHRPRPDKPRAGTSGFVSHRRVVKVRPDSRAVAPANPSKSQTAAIGTKKPKKPKIAKRARRDPPPRNAHARRPLFRSHTRRHAASSW